MIIIFEPIIVHSPVSVNSTTRWNSLVETGPRKVELTHGALHVRAAAVFDDDHVAARAPLRLSNPQHLLPEHKYKC